MLILRASLSRSSKTITSRSGSCTVLSVAHTKAAPWTQIRNASSRGVQRHLISEGRTTTFIDEPASTTTDSNHTEIYGSTTRTDDSVSKSPFYLETGYSIFAKRPSRAFPPPFISIPSGSFSDPLTTHTRSRMRQPSVGGQLVKGITNGDDAILIGGDHFLIVNDGVGAWAQKERGHAALWSRLIAHFWALQVEGVFGRSQNIDLKDLHMVQYLEDAYDKTRAFTSTPNEILGTTTASSALLHYRSAEEPVVLATTLGDCAVHIIRPSIKDTIYKSSEQWHWFDCPRQLGTNSPDTPLKNGVMDVIDIQEDDVVLVMSDGVTDNLWEHEIAEKISVSIEKWQSGAEEGKDGIVYVARELMNAAREIAQDPNAESPYMERALDEGIAAEGGKLDDISVVLGICRRRKT